MSKSKNKDLKGRAAEAAASKAELDKMIRAAMEDGNRLSLMRSAALAQGIFANKEHKKINTCPYRGSMAEMSDWWKCGWWVEQVLSESRGAENA